MIQYILECIAFQLVFLIIFDLFLKRETFFQWNRVYLIGTYILSMVLPWVKIAALKTEVPEAFHVYPEYLWGVNDAVLTVAETPETTFQLSWPYMIFFAGVVFATLFFIYKLYQIYALRKRGEVHYFKDFTQVIVSNSALAFSFFKSIFLGDEVLKKEHQNIVDHELVHIRQKHSYDLMFFELMRIVAWFNPLVYIYQNRVSELHEFIADAKIAKTKKKEQYEFLLSQVFQTQNISFINQFFKTSLIKKRIVMLTKERSKQVFKWKYILLLPVVFGMLLYTSCVNEEEGNINLINETLEVSDIENLTEAEELKAFDRLINLSVQPEDWTYIIKDKNSVITFSAAPENSWISGPSGIPIKAKVHIESSILDEDFNFFGDTSNVIKIQMKDDSVAFGIVDEVPVFPGCENETDKRACFNKMMQRHISKNFRYPQKAQELGIQGRVNTMFTIAEDGSIQDLRMRGPDSILENEVARIIRRLPQMQAGRQNGKVVRVPFSIPVTFKLEQSNFNSFYDEKAVQESESLTGKLFDEVYGDIISFSKVDEVPAFPDCKDDFDKRACFQKSIQRHIGKNFRYPEEAQEKGIQGRVAILFIISKDGSIKGLKTRGPDKLLEAEAERIISRLPQMIPGKHKGKSTDVTFSIPITFKLGSNRLTEDSITLASQQGSERVYIINGKESTKKEFEAMDQNTIKSINFLKDEAAKKKYGEGGKNGVVEVVTKEKNWEKV